MKKLNEVQESQLKELLGFYKHYWICNCGSVYGSDYNENKPICPICEEKLKKEKKKKNE